MKRGVVTRTWETDQYTCIYSRVVSFKEKDLVGHRFVCKAKNQLALLVDDAIDDSVMNLPVNDDQTVENEESLILLKQCRFSWENGILFMEALVSMTPSLSPTQSILNPLFLGVKVVT